MEAITVRVLNWAKYNPRTDRKKHTWFRLENGIPDSQGMHGLRADQCWAWVVLMAEASKNQGEAFELDLEWWASRARTTLEQVRLLVKHCADRKMIEVLAPPGYQAVTTGNQSVSGGNATDGRTDGREDSIESSTGSAENSAPPAPAEPVQAAAPPPPPKRKPRRKPEPVAFQAETELIGAISGEQHALWAKLYPDKLYVARKITQAWGYYHVAQTKPEPTTLAGWVRALNKWLEDDWAKHQAGLSPRASVTQIKAPSRVQLLAVKFQQAMKISPDFPAELAAFLTPEELKIFRKVGRQNIASLRADGHRDRILCGMINTALADEPGVAG